MYNTNKIFLDNSTFLNYTHNINSDNKFSILDTTHFITNVLVIIIIIVGIFLSIFCIYKLCKIKDKKVFHPLLLGLMGANLLFILSKLPLNLSYVDLIVLNYSSIFNSIRIYFFNLFKNCVNLFIVAISIQRYFAVFETYTIYFKLTLCINWNIILCLFICGAIFTYFDPSNYVSIWHIIFTFPPLIIIVALNVKIYIEVNKIFKIIKKYYLNL